MKQVILLFAALIILSCNNTKQEVVEDPQPTNAERIKTIYDAFAEGDVETVLASLTEDVQWNEAENYIYADGNPYQGRDAVLKGIFERVGTEWEYWNLADKAFMNVEADKVLVTGRYQAKNKATGKLLDSQFAHLWTLKDTLAASFQQYTDTKQAAEVIIAEE